MSQPDWGGPLPADEEPHDPIAHEEELYNPITYERDAAPPGTGGIWPDESWPPRLPPGPHRPPRVITAIAAVAVTAAAGTAFALTGGSHAKAPAAGQSAGAPPRPSPRASAMLPPAAAPPLTPSAAQAVLSRYTTANNAANARMDPGLLGGYETGSSEALDAAMYAARRAAGLGPYPAFGPATARFYIPAEPAAYPHWFAVRVANRALGGRHQDLGTEYLLFTQSGPGAAWKDQTEPYLLSNASGLTRPTGPDRPPVPPVALDGAGHATAVAVGAPGLAVAPSGLAQSTADSLDGHGPVAGPGNLADTSVASWWRARLPKGTAVTDRHTRTGEEIIGLRTADGGALLFYTDAAVVTFTAPHGKRTSLRFLEQFATYDPPRGAGGPRVVADYSGTQRPGTS